MTRICILAAMLLLVAGCAGTAPPPRAESPCAAGENTLECQAYRYGNVGM